MSGDRNKTGEKLERISLALARDVDELSEQALFEEAEECYGDTNKAIAAARSIIDSALAQHGKQRLTAARKGYAEFARKPGSTVAELPPRKKRALVERVTRDDPALREKLTMAARNEDDHAADIDSFLEDLVELGVVDEHGNLL